MAKFLCVCGSVVSTSGEIPHPYQWNLISDGDFDTSTGTVDADELYMRSTLMFRCPRSGHLWIYWSGIDNAPSLYSPVEVDEPDGPRGVVAVGE
ncbi:hypothetical protein [Cellulomonas telluris]|uniref:hypothetical protein n=1 Tax=Cellulomonas telluris TaxID=2306636 RepID=UPI0010A79B19|nr:hypothetical protein [Cellulomonas telluris]